MKLSVPRAVGLVLVSYLISVSFAQEPGPPSPAQPTVRVQSSLVLAHAAGAQVGDDFIGPEVGAWSEAHDCGDYNPENTSSDASSPQVMPGYQIKCNFRLNDTPAPHSPAHCTKIVQNRAVSLSPTTIPRKCLTG
jgi:hypothetical protein